MKVFAWILAAGLLLALPFESVAQTRKRSRTRTKARTQAPAPAAVAPPLVYQAAYQHILRSPEFEEYRQPCVAVFDSLVFQDYVTFSEPLRTEWNFAKDYSQVQLLDSLFRMDERADHKPFYSPLAAKLTPASGAQKGCAVILFSRLSQNTLLAEVSLNEEGGSRARDIVSKLNKTLRYLLIIGPDGKVKRYYTKVLNYN